MTASLSSCTQRVLTSQLLTSQSWTQTRKRPKLFGLVYQNMFVMQAQCVQAAAHHIRYKNMFRSTLVR